MAEFVVPRLIVCLILAGIMTGIWGRYGTRVLIITVLGGGGVFISLLRAAHWLTGKLRSKNQKLSYEVAISGSVSMRASARARRPMCWTCWRSWTIL